MNSRWFFSSLVRTEDAARHVCPHPSRSLWLQIHSGPCLTPADHALALLRLPTKPQGLHGCGGGGCLSEAEGAVTWGTRGPQVLVSAQSLGVTGAPWTGTGLSAPPFPTSAAATPESPSVDRPLPTSGPPSPRAAGSWSHSRRQSSGRHHLSGACQEQAGPLRGSGPTPPFSGGPGQSPRAGREVAGRAGRMGVGVTGRPAPIQTGRLHRAPFSERLSSIFHKTDFVQLAESAF